MFKIYHLKVGDRAIIKKINAGRGLKHRMKSFGLYEGVEFEVRNFSIGKNNVELKVGNTHVALRKGEMDKIDIEKQGDEK